MLIAIALALSLLNVSASPSMARDGAVRVFADVPAPGTPFGVLATEDSVYVSTSSGSTFRRGAGTDAVFRYSEDGGTPVAATVETMPDMGLFGMAEDGDGRIYVVDMNGRILRFTPDAGGLGAPEVYATNPYRALGWKVSMWMLPAFDTNGDLYVTEGTQGSIWRIPPGGAPTLWFQDPRLASVPYGGLNGLAIGPDHRLYLAMAQGTIYRLPLSTATPTADKLELFHAFPPDPAGYPAPPVGSTDLAFGRSGKLYVTLGTKGAIAVLNTTGDVVEEITDPRLDCPLGIRFHGTSVLVAVSSYFRGNPDAWKILAVDVGEPGLPLARPHLGR